MSTGRGVDEYRPSSWWSHGTADGLRPLGKGTRMSITIAARTATTAVVAAVIAVVLAALVATAPADTTVGHVVGGGAGGKAMLFR